MYGEVEEPYNQWLIYENIMTQVKLQKQLVYETSWP